MQQICLPPGLICEAIYFLVSAYVHIAYVRRIRSIGYQPSLAVALAADPPLKVGSNLFAHHFYYT